MADPYVAVKTLASGSEQMLIHDNRQYWQRETNLPANWLNVRVGVIISFTTNASDNAAVSAETYSAGVGVNGEFTFGLSNGAGPVGSSGVRALLFGGESDINDAIQLDGAVYRLKSKFRTGIRCDGTTVTRVSGGATNNALQFGLPQNTTSFCLGLMMQFNVDSATGVLTTSVAHLDNLSSTDEAQMMSLLISPSDFTTSTPLNSGWWDLSSNPVDLRYFYIHSPFINHRLRLHNYAVMRLK